MEETSIDDTRPLCSDASGSICNHRKAARKKVTQIDPQRAGPGLFLVVECKYSNHLE